jgi:TetR/AcrR family fatty acid metabolism transcriptional regulator
VALEKVVRDTYGYSVVASARRVSREDKRRRIIDAAVEVFAEKGFFYARVSEIADAAGVADGTIYLYFKSKDDILIAIFEEKMAEILARFVTMLQEVDDPAEKIRRYIIEHLKLVAEQPKLMQVLTVELRQSARFMKEYSPHSFAKYLALVGSILDEGQKKGIFRKSFDPAVFRRALFGAIDELSLAWVLRRDGTAAPNPDYVGEQISDFILRGLRV